jgi:hypothetical protein
MSFRTFSLLITLAGLLSASKTIAQTQQKNFDGLYLTLQAGSQNVFGGSWVNDMDILAQESRFVVDMGAGFRKQFLKERFLLGIEFVYGFMDADLSYQSEADQLSINYQCKTQTGFGGMAGVALGSKRNNLVFVYGNETTRKFEVTIRDEFGPYYQKDEQGMFKYGVGFERHVFKRFNIRASIGGLLVDFGDMPTNIDVEDKLDVMAGLSFQL